MLFQIPTTKLNLRLMKHKPLLLYSTLLGTQLLNRCFLKPPRDCLLKIFFLNFYQNEEVCSTSLWLNRNTSKLPCSSCHPTKSLSLINCVNPVNVIHGNEQFLQTVHPFLPVLYTTCTHFFSHFGVNVSELMYWNSLTLEVCFRLMILPVISQNNVIYFSQCRILCSCSGSTDLIYINV